MAYTPLTQDQLKNAIQLNRVAGESYDQGTPMTMSQAIDMAAQYGAVPSRISSGAADPKSDYSGVWAIPTANGWVPLDKLQPAVSAADAYHGGPTTGQGAPANMVATQQGATSDVLRPPYGSSVSGGLPTNQTQAYWDQQFANDPQVQARQAMLAGQGNYPTQLPSHNYPPSTTGPISSGQPLPMPSFASPQGNASQGSSGVTINITAPPAPGQDMWSNSQGYNADARQQALDAYNKAAAPPYQPGSMSNPAYPFSPNWRQPLQSPYANPTVPNSMQGVMQGLGTAMGAGPAQPYSPGPGISPSLVPPGTPIGPTQTPTTMSPSQAFGQPSPYEPPTYTPLPNMNSYYTQPNSQVGMGNTTSAILGAQQYLPQWLLNAFGVGQQQQPPTQQPQVPLPPTMGNLSR